MQRGCARALLSMWVHAYFFSAICSEHWVLISFGDICLSAYPCSCSYTLTIPPPHTIPYYPQTKHPSCPHSHFKTVGGGLPPSERGGKTYDWRATAPTLFVFVFISTCTMTCQDLTPGFAPSQHPCMQPHFTPTSSPPTPPRHLVTISIGYKTTCRRAHLGLSQPSLRTARPFTSPTRLGKVYKRALVVPPSSPHQRAFVCGACIGTVTAQVGVSLASLFDPLFKRSRLHCFDICLT